MAKKKAAKKKAKPKPLKGGTGEQGTLIDVGPKNSKELNAALAIYKKHLKDRMEAGRLEVEAKAVVLELIANAGLQPQENGHIAFSANDFTVDLEPGKPKLSVKDKNTEYEE